VSDSGFRVNPFRVFLGLAFAAPVIALAYYAVRAPDSNERLKIEASEPPSDGIGASAETRPERLGAEPEIAAPPQSGVDAAHAECTKSACIDEAGLIPAARAAYRKGLAAKQHGDYEAALRAFREAAALEPEDSGLFRLAAEMAKALGRLGQAEALYLDALALDEARFGAGHPKVAAVLLDLATVYVEQERYEEAESLYQRSVDIQRGAFGAAVRCDRLMRWLKP